ncbi:MAG: hypothetical protein C0483_09350 [Pirellula sp.]|nr:hypothetical protein [Pirellula sp.]
MNDAPFALLITWTCYGTWLPGDRRGYVANTRSARGGFEPLRNIPGTPVDADHAETRALARARQSHETTLLRLDDALVVAEGLIEAARSREWSIVRGAVMANHLHLVVMKCPDNGPAVRRVLKGVSQAALNARCGIRKWWTQGGSNRYLHDETSILGAVRYVKQQEFCLVHIADNAIVPS